MCPTGKREFQSSVEARNAAVKMLHGRRSVGSRKLTGKLWPYKCRQCPLWHLTSINQEMPLKKKKQRAERPKKVKQGGATVIVCPAEPKPVGEYGQKSKDGKCPKCGSDVIPGYGIAFHGMGPYETCDNEKCQWYWKKIEDVEQ